MAGEKPMSVEPALLRLGAEELSGVVELATDEGAWLSMQVTPGTLQFEVPGR